MTDTNHTFPKPFEAWLDTATEGVGFHACPIITEELSDHYFSALEDRINAGASREDAEHAALTALGNPKRARRRFRRIYLTPYQEGFIEREWQLPHYEKQTAMPSRKRYRELRWLSRIFSATFFSLFFLLMILGAFHIQLEKYIDTDYWKDIIEISIFVMFPLFFLLIYARSGKNLFRQGMPATYPAIPYPPHKAMRTIANNSLKIIVFLGMMFIFVFHDDLHETLLFIGIAFLVNAPKFITSTRIAWKLKRYPDQNLTPMVKKLIHYSDKRYKDELKPS